MDQKIITKLVCRIGAIDYEKNDMINEINRLNANLNPKSDSYVKDLEYLNNYKKNAKKEMVNLDKLKLQLETELKKYQSK